MSVLSFFVGFGLWAVGFLGGGIFLGVARFLVIILVFWLFSGCFCFWFGLYCFGYWVVMVIISIIWVVILWLVWLFLCPLLTFLYCLF